MILTLAAALFPRRALLGTLSLSVDIPTDEQVFTFESDLGIELSLSQFARVTLGALPSSRVVVKRVLPNSAAEQQGLQAGSILVSANGESLEGRSLEDVASAIGAMPRPLRLVARDPSKFNEQLTPASDAKRAVTSVLADYNGQQQILVVERLRKPEVCSVGAQLGDLIELKFEARLADTGQLFDGAALTFADGTSVPGRGGDSTIYFVLGQQPTGQFPTAWDPALAGACVGEIRRVTVPPVIGFQNKGSPKRGVPPYATLIYVLEVVSINSVAMPR